MYVKTRKIWTIKARENVCCLNWTISLGIIVMISHQNYLNKISNWIFMCKIVILYRKYILKYNNSKYLAWCNGNDQVNYCTRPTAEFNSSLDDFHYRRPSILNYCHHIHQITVLLPNHTFHEEIEHNLDWFSETTFLISFNWFLSHEYLPNAKCVMDAASDTTSQSDDRFSFTWPISVNRETW